jgi:murein L,D-transpeptidase YcbB/YkuD
MYMLPLALTLSILSAVSTLLALEIGNQKSSDLSVNNVIEVSIPEQLEQKIEPWQKTPGSNSTIATTTTTKITTFNPVTTKRKSPNFLVKGHEGEHISILQARVRIAGFYDGNSTGIFGLITEEAVQRFQQADKLNVDGVVGSATLAKLPALNLDGEQTSKKAIHPDSVEFR